MGYDYRALFPRIVAAVGGNGSFTDRIHALIKYCEQQVPHKGWNSLRRLNYEADGNMLTQWLDEALAEAGSEVSYKGLWFGLNNPVIDDQTTADLHVVASSQFSPTSLDWAVDATFFPERGALKSRVLDELYRLAYSNQKGLGNDAEYPLALAYGAMAARAALEANKLAGPFAEVLGAAAGFDSGDFMFLGTFRDGVFNSDVKAA